MIDPNPKISQPSSVHLPRLPECSPAL